MGLGGQDRGGQVIICFSAVGVGVNVRRKMRAPACARWVIGSAARPPKLLAHSTLTILLLAFPCSLSAQKPSAEEQFFFDSANRERVAQRLQPLKWDKALAEAARRHALLMADQASLSHRLPCGPPLDDPALRAGARCSQVGENIAVRPQAPPIHTG